MLCVPPMLYGQTAASPAVRFIRFVGAKSFDTGRLEKIMETQARRFRWGRGHPLDEAVLQKDLERIEKFYKSKGFYDARVLGYRLIPLGGREVILEISVEEGRPVLVESVEVTVDDAAFGPWHDDLLKVIPLKPGRRFTSSDFYDTEKVVRHFLSLWGYPRAIVETQGTMDKEAKVARIEVHVALGPACFFGPVSVEGNQRVETDLIVKELTFRPGERYRAKALLDSQKRLMDLHLFTFVDVQPQLDASFESQVPVSVVVKEAKSQTVRFGAGYGTEDRLRGRVGYEYRNFLGQGRTLELDAKASSLVRFFEGRLTQPHFLYDPLRLSVSGGVSREMQESYTNVQYFLRPQVTWQLNEHWLLNAGPNVEANRLVDVGLTSQAIRPSDQKGEEYYVSSLVFGATYQKVDNILDPRRGVQFFQRLEWGGSAVGSEVGFVKFGLEGRSYLPIDPLGVLAFRAKWGSIAELENTARVPIFKRYFSGGSSSIRGYPYQKLGPLDDDGNPLGGLTLLELSGEWRFPLKNSWEGVLFVDVGNVYESRYELLWDQLRSTVGAGLRYKTPVGPLRLDFGYQLNPPHQDFFNRYQIHLSIGQAF
ncbi:Beta-barrel assembly machine subunit BamA [Desulfosoma caldarium]|uniref:Beta-barrel assembly machine subunit BamA n=2 Tax=Desulfosoma caldarium TaxID=610254 RepID=A0A3N1VF76_9BACT|nr:Beta-barrel assembly machine subunit BamA [Desulfosoma caldarium]